MGTQWDTALNTLLSNQIAVTWSDLLLATQSMNLCKIWSNEETRCSQKREKKSRRKRSFPIFLLRDESDSSPEKALNGQENYNEGEIDILLCKHGTAKQIEGRR